ncbi:MAG: hypothetical protein L6Q99_05725 [Planctomycetes bacterium]|nr:hypothetical protein [Planctomycetota bacterium]
MRFEPLLIVLALVPWNLQTPTTQDPSAQEPKPFPLSDSAVAATLGEQIQGAWQLERIDSPLVPLMPADTEGYALFHDGYMALELHGITPMGLDDSDGEFFQTGFHRYSLDGTGGMETSSLIGVTNLTDDEDIQFQPAGDRRRFRVSLLGEKLTLERTDGTRLFFQKLGKLPFPGAVEQVDAFGRPVKPAGAKPPGQQQR